jgi:serine/threonine protein kinase
MTREVTDLDATLPAPETSTAFDVTRAAADPRAVPRRASSDDPKAFAPPTSAARTTVLPKVAEGGGRVELSLQPRSRYEATKLLGTGGMGEVVLVRDHDIERKVALKRLRPELTDPAILARFVDEIRTVGRLEHPNIVPIHDVGVDELGRYFFVMKCVEGETLESILDKLAAREPVTLEKYSVEVRVELFLGLLHALSYAHAQGVVHRDIKPANVMVGRFGEVVLMDWGIAKPIEAKRDPARGTEGEISADPSGPERARMYATRVGSLIGTPAYMSPEQARGDNDAIDARSDLYSAIVLFHELLGLRHYLAGKETMDAMLAAVVGEPFGFLKLLGIGRQGAEVPRAEFLHLIVKGLSKDPAQRFQSADELIGVIHGILEGKVAVQCHVTFTKRVFSELSRLVDRAPMVAIVTMIGLVAAVVFAVFTLLRSVLV